MVKWQPRFEVDYCIHSVAEQSQKMLPKPHSRNKTLSLPNPLHTLLSLHKVSEGAVTGGSMQHMISRCGDIRDAHQDPLSSRTSTDPRQSAIESSTSTLNLVSTLLVVATTVLRGLDADTVNVGMLRKR